MAKQPKPKAKGDRNDSRKNGKARKSMNAVVKSHSRNPQTPLALVLLGKGQFQTFARIGSVHGVGNKKK